MCGIGSVDVKAEGEACGGHRRFVANDGEAEAKGRRRADLIVRTWSQRVVCSVA